MKSVLVAGMMVAGLLLGACGDGDPATCSSDGDCNDMEVCDRNLCKVCEVYCESDDACAEPYHCEDYGNGCAACR